MSSEAEDRLARWERMVHLLSTPPPPPIPTPPPESKYAQAEEDLLKRYGLSITKMRVSMTGVALKEGLEAPKAKSEISFAILAHEVGHRALGHLEAHRGARWKEEVEAWNFALEQLRHYGFPVSKRVRKHQTEHLSYMLAKALNRGLKTVPTELRKYLQYLNGPPAYSSYRVSRYEIMRDYD